MNTFNKKSLCVALAATGMLGAAGVAQAVNVSENGLGKVLIYPYYTVNKDINGNSYNTLMSVVNTTAQHEGGQGPFPRRQEQRGSAGLQRLPVAVRRLDRVDHAGPAIPSPDRAAATFATSDTSCTIPSFPRQAASISGRCEFESTDAGLARTSEGYFEVFEMATYDLDQRDRQSIPSTPQRRAVGLRARQRHTADDDSTTGPRVACSATWSS